jgi:hypothetical protein
MKLAPMTASRSNGKRLLVLAALGASAAAACGPGGPGDGGVALFSCETETRAVPYAPNLTRPSASGAFEAVLVSSVPAPPVKGTNTWTVRIVDRVGATQADLPMTASTFMPDHNHGSTVKAVVTPMADGLYLVKPLYLYMPGFWQIMLDVEPAAGTTDRVVFPICIPG